MGPSTFSTQAELPLSVEDAWALKDVPEYIQFTSERGGTTYEELSKKLSPDKTTWLIHSRSVSLEKPPMAVRKLLGKDEMVYENEYEIPVNPPPFSYAFRSIPPVMANKISIGGTVVFAESGPGRSVQRIDGTADVKIMGFGGMISSGIIDGLKKSYKGLPETFQAFKERHPDWRKLIERERRRHEKAEEKVEEEGGKGAGLPQEPVAKEEPALHEAPLPVTPEKKEEQPEQVQKQAPSTPPIAAPLLFPEVPQTFSTPAPLSPSSPRFSTPPSGPGPQVQLQPPAAQQGTSAYEDDVAVQVESIVSMLVETRLALAQLRGEHDLLTRRCFDLEAERDQLRASVGAKAGPSSSSSTSSSSSAAAAGSQQPRAARSPGGEDDEVALWKRKAQTLEETARALGAELGKAQQACVAAKQRQRELEAEVRQRDDKNEGLSKAMQSLWEEANQTVNGAAGSAEAKVTMQLAETKLALAQATFEKEEEERIMRHQIDSLRAQVKHKTQQAADLRATLHALHPDLTLTTDLDTNDQDDDTTPKHVHHRESEKVLLPAHQTSPTKKQTEKLKRFFSKF
jgi:hypothetical protein